MVPSLRRVAGYWRGGSGRSVGQVAQRAGIHMKIEILIASSPAERFVDLAGGGMLMFMVLLLTIGILSGLVHLIAGLVHLIKRK